MKHLLILVITILISTNSFCQININGKNLDLKSIKSKTGDNNTVASANNGTQTSSSSASEGPDLGGWSIKQLESIAYARVYFPGGWCINDFSPRSKYNDMLNVPVVEVTYKDFCYKPLFTLLVFKMEDKDAVLGFDFEGESAKKNAKGRYKSKMVITSGDEYLMIFSYLSKIDPKLDYQMDDEIFPGVESLKGWSVR